MSCSCCIPHAANTPHAMPHAPTAPPKKINKKNSEKGSTPTWMPLRGGGTPSRHNAPRFTRQQGPHARHTATMRTAWNDAPPAHGAPPDITHLPAKRPSVRKQPTHTQHRHPTPAMNASPASPEGTYSPPTPRNADHRTTPHPHKALTGQKQPTYRAKAAHPMQCRANRAFSFVSRIYKYYLYNTRNTKKIKSFPRHIHGVKRLFAARQNRAFPGVLFGKLWDSPWVRFEAHRRHGKGIYTHVGWCMYSEQVPSI